MKPARTLLAFLALAAAGPASAGYTPLIGAANPLDLVDTGADSAPAVVRIDGDADFDVFVGASDGTIRFFRNTGSTTAPAFTAVTGTGNPLNGVDVGDQAKPAFADLDADGDADLVVGTAAGTFLYFRNTGSASSPAFTQQPGVLNPLNGVDIGVLSAPALADLDGDGDFDLMAGEDEGAFFYFRNTGTVSAPVFIAVTGAGNPMNGRDVGKNSAPAIADIDGDGDLDLVSGDSGGRFTYFQNLGTTLAPAFSPQTGLVDPFDGRDVGNESTPALVDLDGDGDRDALVGDKRGDVTYLRNDPVSVSTGYFNAVEPGAHVVSGKLLTKIAGTAFNLDIVALNAARTAQDTSYRGRVDVTLMDATSDTGPFDAFGCRTSWSPLRYLGQVNIQNKDNGRDLLVGAVHADAVRVARLRVLETNGSLGGCSLDAFAIRPASFLVAATDGSATGPGTARTLNALSAAASPFHHAGRPFTVTALARNSAGVTTPGYTGAPSIAALASVLGTAVGTASAASWTTTAGEAVSNTATYSEAGAFTLQLLDDTFAAIDAADAGSTLAQRRIGPVTINVGRFTPADFQVAFNTPRFSPACGSFTYVGQPFMYATPPQATLTAINAGGGTTTNYRSADGLFKLSSASITGKLYLANNAQTLAVVAGNPGVALTEAGNGVATVTFDNDVALRLALSRGAATAPFDAELRLQASVADGDGVAHSGNPFGVGATSAGNGIAFGASGLLKQFRFGRLRLVNAYGSELFALPVPMRVEHVADLGGTPGFVAASDDGCTTGAAILPGHVALDTSPLVNPAASIAVTPLPISAGSGAIRLGAPSPVTTGRIGVLLNLAPSYPWLQVDSTGDGVYAENPASSASFGLYGDDRRRVYSREYVR